MHAVQCVHYCCARMHGLRSRDAWLVGMFRLKEMERCRTEKAEAEKELTQLKASTELDTQRSDLSGHPQFQRVSETCRVL